MRQSADDSLWMRTSYINLPSASMDEQDCGSPIPHHQEVCTTSVLIADLLRFHTRIACLIIACCSNLSHIGDEQFHESALMGTIMHRIKFCAREREIADYECAWCLPRIDLGPADAIDWSLSAVHAALYSQSQQQHPPDALCCHLFAMDRWAAAGRQLTHWE